MELDRRLIEARLELHRLPIHPYVSFPRSAERNRNGGVLWTGGVTSLAWSPDGTKLAAASREIWTGGSSTIDVWAVATGQLLHEFEGHTADVPALAFSPDGACLASGSTDSSVIVWDISQ